MSRSRHHHVRTSSSIVWTRSDARVLGAHRIGIRHVWHQRVRWDRPEPTSLEILEGLHDLVPGVHDEGSVVLHRLSDRLATEHEDLEEFRVRESWASSARMATKSPGPNDTS